MYFFRSFSHRDLKKVFVKSVTRYKGTRLLNGSSDGKNYNPMMHCKQHNQIKNDGEI